MKASVSIGLVFAVAVVSTAQAQVDHLQCHKVKDSIKFSGTVVALTAQQAAFQLPGNCTLSGKAAEFCVPVDKNVVDPGDAPGSLIGPAQDLSSNDYVCYKIKCPKTTIPDTVASDQFGARSLVKIKTAGKLCVPAVKGVATTTTTTLATTTTTSTTSTTTVSSSSTTSTTQPEIVEIACNWPGEARWLSHGFDGANAFATGAWLSCIAGVLSDVRFVNDGGTAVTPPSSGTSDARVGCNWVGARWASQGYDGAAAFAAGATVNCDGEDVTGLAWESNVLGATAATAGNLACNWSGAIYLSHGLDSGCAFQTGFNVTCNANQITHFQWVEGGGCPSQR